MIELSLAVLLSSSVAHLGSLMALRVLALSVCLLPTINTLCTLLGLGTFFMIRALYQVYLHYFYPSSEEGRKPGRISTLILLVRALNIPHFFEKILFAKLTRECL